MSSAGYLSAQEVHKEKITILFGHRFPPFYSITSKSETHPRFKGLFIDILEKFAKSHPQYEIEYKCLPRERINKVLTEEKADCFALSNPMFLSKEIQNKYVHSAPLWKISDHLLVKVNSNIKESNIEKLSGKKLAVLHGNSYGPLDVYFSKGIIRKQAVYRTSQFFKLLVAGRVDGAICNKRTLPTLMGRTKYSKKDFRLIEKPLYEYYLHLLIKRDKLDFLADFNAFIVENKIIELN
ncbi:ABC transporter substrate-binding protein [Desulfovibrio sp. UCD-KL4C]|uniref:substrate-binding periplasmic protein n=1 Tax=Desulfovibrio sp. UCD-KL4C TaxID=2578120 RepID=UPI0025C41231|nr:transporter substrate-binding domain-containing protein [Desulfovibrio sp. UCD-KL4C]